jgi:hypothetical protein
MGLTRVLVKGFQDSVSSTSFASLRSFAGIYQGDFSSLSIQSYYTTFLSRGSQGHLPPTLTDRSDLAPQDAAFGKALSFDCDSPGFTFPFRLKPCDLCVPPGFEKSAITRILKAPEEQHRTMLLMTWSHHS